MDIIINAINYLIKGIGSFAGLLINLLPPSPFKVIDNTQVGEFIRGINWILPIGPAMTILEAWVVCIAIYYVIMIALRWVKAIE